MYLSPHSVNFLMSGMAVGWHFTGDRDLQLSLVRLFRFHWGSVAGGAFLLNILYPFDLVYDLLKPKQTVRGNSCLSGFCCCCCERVLDLARTEAMAMVNLLGTPYCNSSRLCEQIVFFSNYTSGSESANRVSPPLLSSSGSERTYCWPRCRPCRPGSTW
jgi:hypothetical protein